MNERKVSREAASDRKRIERLRGMHDLLPDEYLRQRVVIERMAAFLARAGYTPVDAPILEQSDLFHNSFGQELWQNLYAFRLHHRDLCLRPEYTASICRLYLDHYQQQALPLRFQYTGPIFRYEAPGRNRYRQHTQVGIELFGGQSAAADAEILQLACDTLNMLRIPRYRIEVGHIGIASGFIQRLHLDDHAARLLLSLMEQISRSEQGEQAAQARLESLYPLDPLGEDEVGGANGLSSEGRTEAEARLITSLMSSIHIPFDDSSRQEIIDRYLWKMGRSTQGRQILYALEFLRALHATSGRPPAVFDHLRDVLQRYSLDPAALDGLRQLVSTLEQCGVPAEQIVVNLSLGRGVNYYTGLVFEIHTQDEEGYDTQLCGGGRYDRLVRAVGGARDVNACGFAFGVDRLLSLLPGEDLPVVEATQVLVIPVAEDNIAYALRIARTLREGGALVELDVSGHGVGPGLKLAGRKHIRLALIVGEDEQRAGNVTLRDLETREEHTMSIEQARERVRGKEQFV
ncbi:MAG TPA: HisS family protein [Ktedonobacteraceae bacterium]|nr:HisS family protein [Ktedonobacteraceae bacterium]